VDIDKLQAKLIDTLGPYYTIGSSR
jgi:hypothetical protein